ncbi:MAG: ABC transporter substrate-binding protein [Limnochordales bacterium]|nr:ABC transporter substrate-binding protein [Limnochordales bacterium]
MQGLPVRRIASVFVGLALILVLGVAAAWPARGAESTRKPVTITFWNWWDGDREAYMKAVIDAFEKQYPWINVESKIQGWDNLSAKIISAFAAGIAPEVMMAPRAEVLALADMGAIIPITEYVKRDKLDLSIFYPAEVNAFRYEGELWTLPLPTVTANDDFYFYNKELFEQAGLNPERPPETWSSFMAAGQKLTRFAPDGRITQLFSRMSPHMYLDFLFSNDGDIVTSDLRRQAIDSKESQETLQFMYDYAAKINGGAKQTEFLSRNNPRTGMAFMNGKEVVLFENISMMNLIIDEMKKGTMFDWGIGLIPYNDRNPRAKSTGVAARGFGWGYVIPKGLPKEKEEAAWLWVKFLTTEGTGIFSFLQGRPSPVRKFNENPEYRKLNPNWDKILRAMETDKPLPALPIIRQLTDAIINGLYGVTTASVSPTTAINNIANNVQNQLDKYWAERARKGR